MKKSPVYNAGFLYFCTMKDLTEKLNIDPKLRKIVDKIYAEERLSPDEGLTLYECNELGLLASLAETVKRKISGDKVCFNRNFHIEPTNICVFACKFCSYRRSSGQEGAWDRSVDEMLEVCKKYRGKEITEVHIVGGVHPKNDLHFFGNLIVEIKKILPGIHVKAFTAIEIDYMSRISGIDTEQSLKRLKEYGLDSIPGGGAEIFDEELRKKICGEKSPGQTWLDIHETAHRIGIPSNASMLFGHVESYKHRIKHLSLLRDLQDRTGGFNAFVPLKYKSVGNRMSRSGEVNTTEVMKNFAVSRLFLDNIPHLKSYWPMQSKDVARMALSFGADDMDGTINDSTKIYSMAGSVETNPTMSIEEMTALIRDSGFVPVERDSLYNEIKIYR